MDAVGVRCQTIVQGSVAKCAQKYFEKAVAKPNGAYIGKQKSNNVFEFNHFNHIGNKFFIIIEKGEPTPLPRLIERPTSYGKQF